MTPYQEITWPASITLLHYPYSDSNLFFRLFYKEFGGYMKNTNGFNFSIAEIDISNDFSQSKN